MMLIVLLLMISIMFVRSNEHVDFMTIGMEQLDTFVYDNLRLPVLVNASLNYRPKPLSTRVVDGLIDKFLVDNLASYKPVHPLLCVTFAEATEDFLKGLTEKFTQVNGTCDWAVLFYRGQKYIADQYEKELKTMDLKGNRVVLFHYNMNRLDLLDKYGIFPPHFFAEAKLHPNYDPAWDRRAMIAAMLSKHQFNKCFITKPLLMTNLIPIARQYEYVWVFDGDMSVDDFDVSRLHRNLHCAFEHPPMVAQPLVYESTQLYWYFNRNFWYDTNRTDVIAHETSFIEVQTPIFNGLFLEFYLSKVVSRMLWSVNALGFDYGYDNTFCPMATSYAKRRELALYKLRNKVTSIDDATEAMISSRHLTPCAVIVDGSNIHHHDQKAIGRFQHFHFRQVLIDQSIQNFNLTFPEHFFEGHIHPEIQPYGIESKLKESKSLKNECRASYVI